MNKQEFLFELKKKISVLPKRDVNERINFYSEMIDDRIEEGLSEEEAVLMIGSAEEIASQIIEELSNAKKDERIARSSRMPRPLMIFLLILGSPVWIPILLSMLIIVFSFYAVLWSLVAALWVLELPFLIFSFISKGLFWLCKKTTVASAQFTKKGAIFIKSFFTRKGEI